jgi:antitoxin YefM
MAYVRARESPAPAAQHSTQRPSASDRGNDPLDGGVFLARILARMIGDHIPLAEVKNRLSEVVDRIRRQHGRVVITKHGHPAAVILSLEDLESLEESLEILSDPEMLEAIREAQADVDAGRTEPLTREQALALIRKR